MPATLRHINPHAGARLRELEAATDVLEQVARAVASPKLHPHPYAKLARRCTVTARARLLRPAHRAASSALARAERARRSPGGAAAFRYIGGWLSETARYLVYVAAVLLALALAIGLRAPPY
jgi:hypothetical protein